MSIKLLKILEEEVSFDDQVEAAKENLLNGGDFFSAKVSATDWMEGSGAWHDLLKRTWKDHYSSDYTSVEDYIQNAAIWFYVDSNECLYISAPKDEIKGFTNPNVPCPSELDAVERLNKLEGEGKLYDIQRKS